ncbi:MAG TPA: nitroreductase family protein, partial [Ferruginibacter sp.]|nr:nitroreductase family protein [Ferruginibacter sp.]HNL64854.1 nitroreductase family protein [Ferruginibacter sp.]
MNDQKLINGYPFIAYTRTAYTDAETQQRARDFYTEMDQRRTCRDFSSRPVDKRVIEDLIRTASTAPSGAHKQPWTFCAVQDPAIKKQIRIEAEKEEYESYNGRMPAEWLADLAPLQTGWQKEFLE